jgi:predicted RNA binding protein YcfA (HicA-like mRNA interferase family)
MSKQEKRIRKLCKNPPPTDFRWDDLVAMMNAAGFVESCDGGSHYEFQHESGFTFTMSRTHPDGLLKRYQVKAAKDALRQVGALTEDCND